MSYEDDKFIDLTSEQPDYSQSNQQSKEPEIDEVYEGGKGIPFPVMLFMSVECQ